MATFSTTDTALAAVFMSMGYFVTPKEAINGRFTFEVDGFGCETVESLYERRQLNIDVHTFYDNYKVLCRKIGR